MMKESRWNMKPNRAKAIMLAKRQLSEFVHDAVNLEGINFTLPEIQTLLDGITVGGHKVADQQIAINQADTWRRIFKLLEKDQFEISLEQVCALHRIAAKEEALEWGKLRSGGVTIAGVDYMPPSAAHLPDLFEKMVDEASKIADIYDRAIHIFLTMARWQFFYDVNKRMGRFVMNGLKGRISPEMLSVFEVGVRYQMYHAFALIVTAWVQTRWPSSLVTTGGWSFVIGTILFSGSLYLLSLTGIRWLGAIKPLGGLAFLTGWVCLAWGVWQA
jgi:uncharacterized membrane protein YgdD (TMEM256/DUF423 family)